MTKGRPKAEPWRNSVWTVLLAVIFSSLSGFVGAYFGALVTTKTQVQLASQERQAKALADLLTPVGGNHPIEILELIQFYKELAFSVFADAQMIRELGALQQSTAQNAGPQNARVDRCWNRLDEFCRDFTARQLVIYRKGIGSGNITPEEMRSALELSFQRAERNMRLLQGK